MKSWWIVLAIGTAAIVFGLFVFLAQDSRGVSEEGNRVSTPTQAILGSTIIALEIARMPAERALGLSGRESLPKNRGLLFIFEENTESGFWMKDMYFPIDIIWLDEHFTVVTIKENALPESYPEAFYPAQPARYVLEVNAGVAQETGVKEGDIIIFNQ